MNEHLGEKTLAYLEIPQDGWRKALPTPDRPEVQAGERFVGIQAGSGYGNQLAWYSLLEGRLVLRDKGDHDNLAGNSVVCDFEGLTLEEARDKAESLNSEGSGHAYDGCHACCWSVGVFQGTPPKHLTYSAPQEAEIIRAALAVFHKEHGSMGRLKAAVRALD